MISRKYGLIALLLIIFTSCTSLPSKSPAEIYDEGVSRSLAEWRSTTLNDVTYDLHFSIPEERSEAVCGQVIINFEVATPQEIVIDYRQSADHIEGVMANGSESQYIFQNEHIIIPDSVIHSGHNSVCINFIAGDQSINRNDNFLYTLLVPDRARTLFPCFDQPNIKARYTLSLEIPERWVAVSNTAPHTESVADSRKHISFNTTEPLSSYLFSFVAGELDSRTYDDGTHRFTAYYRESDPKRLAQLDIIFEQVAASLEWLEAYTAIPYPFAKYDLIILPGFQYGGMEHTGATLYNDTQMFLGEHPTPDEELRRIELIAHETAHMWFGDYVTMAWFDDVWTKEVFANYFAARITEPLFPEINHRLSFMKNYAGRALAEDNTLGTTSIRQPLDNLQNAGLVYGNIIYNKAPVMMEKLVEIMGEEAFRDGIREYLNTFAYGNATWNDLIAILDKRSAADLAAFSDVWVNSKGLPHIQTSIEGSELVVRQSDPYARGLCWPQSFSCGIITEDGSMQHADIDLYSHEVRIPLSITPKHLLPNIDGRGYGLFILDEAQKAWLLKEWTSVEDETSRQALLMILKENYEAGVLDNIEWQNMLLNAIEGERNALICSTLCSYLYDPMRTAPRADIEAKAYRLALSHPLSSCQRQLLRTLTSAATSKEVCDKLYALWLAGNHPLLGVTEYMNLAYELAVRYPEQYDYIVELQRSRITDSERRRQFDYIIRASHPDSAMRDALFTELLEPENRRTEPWAATLLSLLNHPLRETEAVKYIRPALEEMREVQRTGDIFFPRNWAGAVLGNYRSAEAYNEVEAFFEDHNEYPTMLKNKILQAAHPLYRTQKSANRN
ncbi:MAG: ERAP1-like C-terminal domain-containing protein [Alistipes sp.]|nr:ERAP1-like C-terminal domain-containing protein [Alistipes sp.]